MIAIPHRRIALSVKVQSATFPVSLRVASGVKPLTLKSEAGDPEVMRRLAV